MDERARPGVFKLPTFLLRKRTVQQALHERGRQFGAEALEGRVLLSTATFAEPAHYNFSSIPRDTTIADFNSDGAPDIASVLPVDSDVGILLNNGDGTFTRGQNLHDGTPRAVAAADFDHNGIVDLAILGGEVSTTGGSVEIFAGNGDGTFAKPPQHYHLTGVGSAIEAVDLNGDGYADLVMTTAKRVAVLMNLGNGTFAPAVYYASGGDRPTGLSVGDLNNDGLPDLVVSRGKKTNVSVLLANPAAPGTFGLPTFFPAGGNASAVTLGDFNGDGHLDIAVTNSDFEQTALGVLIGNGDGTFRPAAMYTGANFSDAVVAGDFSGTGVEDIVVGSFDSQLKLYPGNGDGTFATPVVVDGGQFTQRLRTADFNSDGRLDVLTTPYTGVRVLLNTTGTVTPPPGGTGLDKTLGAGGPKTFSFYTPEGTFATVLLTGPGAATLHFSASGTVDIPNGRETKPVTSLTLADIAATGTTSGSALAIKVRGRSGSRTVNLDSITADSAIGSIQALRTNVSGDVTLPGGVGQIQLLSANSGTITIGAGRSTSISVQQIGGEIVNSAATIASLSVRLDAGITLTARSIGMMQIGGSLINSTITLTDGFAAGVMDLRNAVIGRDITNSAIFSAGNIGTIEARGILSSTIQAGLAANLAVPTLPASDADFATTASIGRLTLGGDPRRVSFVNSSIAASAVGTLALGRIETDNGGVPFGVAGRTIKVIQGTDINSHRAFKFANITSTAEALAAFTGKGIDPLDLAVEIL